MPKTNPINISQSIICCPLISLVPPRADIHCLSAGKTARTVKNPSCSQNPPHFLEGKRHKLLTPSSPAAMALPLHLQIHYSDAGHASLLKRDPLLDKRSCKSEVIIKYKIKERRKEKEKRSCWLLSRVVECSQGWPLEGQWEQLRDLRRLTTS